MGNFFTMVGGFITGVSFVGLLSYTAYAFQSLRLYSLWLGLTAIILLMLGVFADDFLAEFLGLTHEQYLGCLMCAVAMFIAGGVIQWLN